MSEKREMEELKKRLAKLLLEKSYIEKQVTLTSGKKSNYYFDCKPTSLHPEGSYLIGKLFFQMLPEDVQGVAGMSLGGDPLVTAVTVVSYLEGRPLPGLIVRKKPKAHGTQNYVEGLKNFKAGQRVVVLEDVITTGGSALLACERIKEVNLEVNHIFCILDRQEGGKERIEEKGIKLISIFTREDLFKLASLT